jgi:hypothetical protein
MSVKEINHIGQLISDPRNARVHTERNISVLANGLQEVGAGRSILIDEKGEIIAGNGVVEAAAIAGITKVRVIDASGDEIIAVRRKDLKGKKKTRMALLDNRSQEIGGGWNTDVIKDLAHEDEQLLKGLWGEEELDVLLEKPSPGFDDDPVSPGSQENKPEESKLERMVLWIPKSEYDSFLGNVKDLQEAFQENDISKVIIEAVERCHGST